MTGAPATGPMAAGSIMLVSMPWARADAPSLQLGLLKARLAAGGRAAAAYHAPVHLERILGRALYWRMANGVHPVLAEACFSAAGGGADAGEVVDLLERSEELSPGDPERVLRGVGEFLEMMEATAPWKGFSAAGFTCTFPQVQASLWACGKAIRAGCRTVLGGFMASGGMGAELLRNPCVTAVVDGPGERALERWLGAGCPPGLFRDTGPDPEPSVPDFGEYFASLEGPERERSVVVVEASRGCEHGACAFCGEPAGGRRIRRPGYVAECLGDLHARHRFQGVEFADASFPPAVFAELRRSGVLRRLNLPLGAFTECRALSPDEMRDAAAAGFTDLQTGVESLSPRVLARIGKGATLLDALCAMRESWNGGLRLAYNIILDHPGTEPADLARTAILLPLLHHLPPPSGLVPFKLMRGSRVFRSPESFGLSDVAPLDGHHLLAGGQAALYHGFATDDPLPDGLLGDLHARFREWEDAFDPDSPLCEARILGDRVEVKDLRPAAARPAGPRYALGAREAAALAACRAPAPEAEVWEAAGRGEALLAELERLGLVLRDGGFCLALPVLLGEGEEAPPQPRREAMDSHFAPSPGAPSGAPSGAPFRPAPEPEGGGRCV